VAAIGAGGVGAAVGAATAQGAQALTPADASTPGLGVRIRFDGPHQAGILTPHQDQATFVALDSIAPTQGALLETLVALSSEARKLTQGDRRSA
jgi:deferrochelatase/peroxidase EfeB